MLSMVTGTSHPRLIFSMVNGTKHLRPIFSMVTGTSPGYLPLLFSYSVYIGCVVLQGCPSPMTFYELALIIICPFPAIFI
jgi:hypothetical protein